MKPFEGKFHLELSMPHKVVQGAVGDLAWGHYNFPYISYTKTGAILASWGYGEDKVGGVHHAGGVRPPFVSYDGGVTWSSNEKGETEAPRNLMPDGKYFLGFCGKSQVPVTYALGLEPPYRFTSSDGKPLKMFFAEDFGEIEDTIVKAQIYDPTTDTVEIVTPTVNWPYAPLLFWPGDVAYPLTHIFAMGNNSLTVNDGVLYICLYMYGFDSTAPTRAEAFPAYDKYSVYVLSSEDCGHTWNFLSQIPVTPETWDDKPNFEGFCEPKLTQMPDDSFVMLMRSGGNHTLYLARSTDKCRTWPQVQKFDEFGVKPQLITLGCGVTLAGYGRPKLRLRATADPAGLIWEEPITVQLSAPEGTRRDDISCFYVQFIPVDDTSALWVYADSQYPTATGERAKAIMVQRITVVKD